MDKRYIKIFSEIIKVTEGLTQQVMSLNEASKDEKGYSTALTMHDDYHKLYERLTAADFDENTLTKSDYARLLVGTTLAINLIDRKINNEKQLMDGYKNLIVPKLTSLLDSGKNDEELHSLANEIFQVIEKNE